MKLATLAVLSDAEIQAIAAWQKATPTATVLCDNPALTARIRGGHDPRRIIVDARLRTSPEARVYDPAERPPILITSIEVEERLALFRIRGVEVIVLPAPARRFDLDDLLTALGARDIVSLLVEAGGNFAGALLDARLVQKLRLYFAPLLIGGAEAVPAIAGLGAVTLADAPRLRDVAWKRIGENWRVEGEIAYSAL